MQFFSKAIFVALLCFLLPYQNHAQNDASSSVASRTVEIEKRWELPEILNEISAMAWLEENKIACIQDEDGIIFIYDLEKEKITEKHQFGKGGDYEGLALHEGTAYVMRSDGWIFEVTNFRKENRQTTRFKTPFREKNNMETLSLAADKKHLISIPKDKSLKKKRYKGLYKISLAERKMSKKPFLKIDMKAGALKKYKEKKLYKTFRPSDVVIHPKTGDYYVLEGKRPKLLILDAKASIKEIYKLNKTTFAQPEGIIFSPSGKLYISNEANGGTPNILRVRLHY